MFYSELGTSKLVLTNSLNNALMSNHRSNNLLQQQIFRQQNSINIQSGVEGLSAPSGGSSPCAPKSFVMQNPNTTISCYNNGYSNQTLMVCSPSTVTVNIQNNVARSMPLATNLSNTMTLTKFPSMNSSNTLNAVSPVSFINKNCLNY